MSNAFTLQLSGVDDVIKRLENAEKIIQVEAQAKISDGAAAIASEAKQRAPVDYGFLKNLISSTKAENSNDGYSAEVISGADYSAYVEFGTGTKIQVPTDLVEFALQFKGKKQVPGMKAQPFFFPAANRILPIIKADLQKTLDKI